MAWRFEFARQPLSGRVGIYMGKSRSDGRFDLVENMTFHTMEEGDMWEPISIPATDSEEFLRAAMNCAWDAGIRPDGYSDTRESLKHIDAHLQDMRALAFHKVGASKP